MPRKTRTRAMRLREHLQRASTEEIIQAIRGETERGRDGLERVRKRRAERREQWLKHEKRKEE